MPHRQPFLFVDQIVSVDLGKSIHAQKNVSINEDFFNGHFPNKPIMPGVLIIEGSIYYFAGVDKVRFKHPVSPGNTIDLYASIRSEKRGIWKFDCTAKTGGKNVCEATILCADRPK